MMKKCLFLVYMDVHRVRKIFPFPTIKKTIQNFLMPPPLLFVNARKE